MYCIGRLKPPSISDVILLLLLRICVFPFTRHDYRIYISIHLLSHSLKSFMNLLKAWLKGFASKFLGFRLLGFVNQWIVFLASKILNYTFARCSPLTCMLGLQNLNSTCRSTCRFVRGCSHCQFLFAFTNFGWMLHVTSIFYGIRWAWGMAGRYIFCFVNFF